jgi:cell shape-determining protein MreC
MDGKWLSVLEYAAYKNKSISTVRRYIKASRVKFKDENGKYFIWVKNFSDQKTNEEKEVLELKLENERLKKENRIIKEEINELKMLVQIYESEKTLNKNQLPELPTEL